MNKALYCLLPLLVLLQSCAAVSQFPVANPQQISKALLLKPDMKYANIYIRRESAFSGKDLNMDIEINNELIGQLDNGSYTNFKVIPGTYTISISRSIGNHVYPDKTIFKYKFKQGEVSLIQCALGNHPKNEIKNILGGKKQGGFLSYILNPCWLKKAPSEIKPMLKNDKFLLSSRPLYSQPGYFEYRQVKQKNTIDDYQKFVTAFPATAYTSNAQSKLVQLKETRRKNSWNKLTKQQKCTLQHNDWLYIDKNCKGKMANGKGRAVYIDTRHTFNGMIKNGQFISGKYLLDGQTVYDGHFKNGKPGGKGICQYEGALEECKFYNGERVDSLYKQRIEMAKMEKRQQQELEKIRGEISELRNNRTHGRHSANGKDIGDVLLDKAIDKGMEKVFDSLF